MEKQIYELLKKIDNNHENVEKIFISIGAPNVKAQVILIKNTIKLKYQLFKLLKKYNKRFGYYPSWVKVDVVTNEQHVLFDDVTKELINTRRNYVTFGFALDERWSLSFLPEEINANAFVRPSKSDKNNREIAENNITHFLKHYKNLNINFSLNDYFGKKVTTFLTQGYFIAHNELYDLYGTGYMKGIRRVNNLTNELDKLIETSTNYLKNEIQENGKFVYGYFPHFDRKINYYNVLRHSSSAYALTEGLNYLNEDTTIIEKTLTYIINYHYYEDGNNAYIFDDTNNINEIKLGQNASFIFAVCEYLNTTKNADNYLVYAQKVANGILTMIDFNNMKTKHVLNYPDLSVKEDFRVIYYDGEAALALLRLYEIDGNKKWLETVENLFEQFIFNKYWEYNDHWLGYCTNELVKYLPKEKYYRFGMLNVSNKLNYIYHRETTFPTFLEMLMSTYHLVQSAKNNGYSKVVEEMIDEEKLLSTIHKRADYERTGYFYPEVAMYFKNPQRILGSFFIKHHGYRVRIDDIEHYLSGYVQYQLVFK
ncbi:poly (glycerol-phosphate) alpha-glucosyltransferase [Staphylococcus kloosii]|uniref:Poly(Glycerol-phosphate) alpha-glucosyltransferase n=1 Tax=Staphylococcus kloosii TaxID=29384 RepID=A0ABQ0XIL8_9STAP|nr:hypothetical protein SKL01_04810 [Staphylococcus kloosii]SUM47941.1 poly (glycerol-phosphate) alpha-glucosyltransferase [Staphylococcus kloosii]